MLDNDRQEKQELADPDVWTVVNLAVSAVAMFGQLGSLALQAKSSPKPPASSPLAPHLQSLAEGTVERLKDDVHSAIRSIQKVIRLLSRTKTPSGGSPLRTPFQFGFGGALFDVNDFNIYREAVSELAVRSSSICNNVTLLIQNVPQVSDLIGNSILKERPNIAELVNDLYRSSPENERVLDICIDLLGIYNRALADLDRLGNMGS